MKLAVVCANGKAGKMIVREAVGRGLDVTAVVRGRIPLRRHRPSAKTCST